MFFSRNKMRCVCVFVSHHGLGDEQQQHGLLHHVLRTEATANGKTGSSSKNGTFRLPHTHTHTELAHR